MSVGVERGLAVAAALVLVVSVVAVVAPTGTAAERSSAPSFDADVPDEYTFADRTEAGTATVDGQTFESAQAAVDAAAPGDTVRLRGRFDERVVVTTPNLTLSGPEGSLAVVDGSGRGNVLTLDGANATVRRLWVRNSGPDASNNDAGVWLNSTGARVVDSRVTDVTFGIWVDGVDDVVLANNTVVGREAVRPLSYRGNGIQLWKTEGALVSDNRITDVRDGIYYSWASHVTARNNTMWDLRYGVHYMYSDDSRLEGNLAFDNDVGYALMVSKRLELVDNVAVNNSGTSGHGILVKDIDDTVIRGNDLVGNRRGIYVYNSLNNTVAGNLVLENDVGVQFTAGSSDERVHNNSFVHNDRPVLAVTSRQVAWNGTGRGNYWSGARGIDRDDDGVSDVRYRPAGLAEYLVQKHPQAAVFAESPAFDAIRLAESSFPVVESPGVVDHYPLVEPPHDHWRRYYERD
jgi:nitrous oxidase accessory protein